jgi:hypothetical protein
MKKKSPIHFCAFCVFLRPQFLSSTQAPKISEGPPRFDAAAAVGETDPTRLENHRADLKTSERGSTDTLFNVLARLGW